MSAGDSLAIASAHRKIARILTFEVERRPHLCVRCGSTTKLHVHHKDDDYTNQAKNNREVVCHDCHKRKHRKRKVKRRPVPADQRAPQNLRRYQLPDYQRTPWLRPGPPL